MKWWLIFAGGGAGSMLRYAVGLWVETRTGPGFPWGTFAVNASGCFLIGVLATLADEHAWITPAARLALVTGFLGGFTTFSTFGLETWVRVHISLAILSTGRRCSSGAPTSSNESGASFHRPRTQTSFSLKGTAALGRLRF